MNSMIEVRDVSMRFRMANDNIHSIKEYAVQRLKGKLKYNEFEALSHVTFDVKPGEVIGYHRPQRRGEKHAAEGDFRYSQAHGGQRDRAGQHCAHAGVGQRV